MARTGVYRTHTDFSGLLTELQHDFATTHSESTATDITDEHISDETENKVPQNGQIIPFADGFPDNDLAWQRAKSDESIKYAVYFNEIHDKCCPRVQDLPAHLINFVKDYPTDGVQCGDCAARVYIRNGAEDIGNLDKYLAFFQRFNWKAKSIKKLYIDHEIRTKIDTDVLTIWYKEDTWKIKALPGGTRVELLHNNYVIRNGQRFFTNGFHTQIPYADFNDAINNILTYDYRKHLQPSAEPVSKPANTVPISVPVHDPETEHKPESLPKEKKKRPSLRTRMKNWIRLFMLRYLGLEHHVQIDGITSIKYAGKPKAGDICAILWKDDDGEEHWMIASYSPKKGCFGAILGSYQIRIPTEKVFAWKVLDMSEFGAKPNPSSPGLFVIK